MFYPPMIGYLLITAVSVCLIAAQRKKALDRNMLIGIRTRHTLASDAAWEKGQRAGMPYLFAMAVIGFSHAAVLLAIELSSFIAVGHIISVSGWVLIVACAIFAWKAANTAAKTARS